MRTPSNRPTYIPLNPVGSALTPPHRRIGSSSRILRHSLFFFGFLALLLSFAAYTNLSDSEDHQRSMRLCLPVDLNRISKTGHRAFSCLRGNQTRIEVHPTKNKGEYKGISSMNGESSKVSAGEQSGRLADFLRSQKETFLAELGEGRGEGWVVAMGNEAGDLDSLASSIAYSALSSSLNASRSIPLILTPADNFKLRPENIVALSRASVPTSALLHVEDLPISTHDLAGRGVKYALVDHNSLLPQFRPTGNVGEDPVTAIVDHHVDDNHHPQASPRLVSSIPGSCSSMVTMEFAAGWEASLGYGGKGGVIPSELGLLLLSAGMIDTGGYKEEPGSKTSDLDVKAKEFLLKVIGDLAITKPAKPSEGGEAETEDAGTEDDVDFVKAYTKELQAAKFDVSNLTSRELLLRDYKEYDMDTADGKVIRVGLSTVPLGLKTWLTREGTTDDEDEGWTGFLSAMDGWMEERDITVEGVLTTFREPKEGKENGKGRREIVLVVRTTSTSSADLAYGKKLFKALEKGMEGSGMLLDLESWPGKKAGALLSGETKDLSGVRSGKEGRWGQVWRQANTSSTRKQIQPTIHNIIADFA